MMEKFLFEYAPKKKSGDRFRGLAKNLISFMGDFTLLEITPKLVNEYKVKRYQDGVKPATINREIACLKRAFNLAYREWEWIRENPISRVSMEKENNKRDRWLSYDEELRLLNASPDWMRDLIVFALNTGMRLSEILTLTWDQIDLNRKILIIFNSKNGERRGIPLNEIVFEMLKNKSKVRSIKTNLVFYNDNHKQFNKVFVSHRFAKIVKKSGIDDFRFHDLRHTFATRLVQAGVDIYRVSHLLGHKDLKTTQRYAHHYPESLRSAVEALYVANLSQTADC
jgi:site-specific recombinase XerD